MSVIPSVGRSIRHPYSGSQRARVPFATLWQHGKANLVGRSGVLRKLLGGQQLVGSERHGQELLESHDGVLAVLVVHQDGNAGLFNKDRVSQGKALQSHRTRLGFQSRCKDRGSLTSQNSRMNCLHMPQGLAGGEMSVATAMARKSPVLAPCSNSMISRCLIPNTKHTQRCVISLTC
jgi:hypothetical protein